jgi:hypothetical protein
MKNGWYSKLLAGLITGMILMSVVGSSAKAAMADASKPANLPAGLSAQDWAQIKASLPAGADIVPAGQQAYLKASNTGKDDFFGYVVSLDGDTLVVGAYGESSNATGVNGDQADDSASYSGAVYVFIRSGTIWSQQAYLKASNAEAGDFFGYSVSLSGNTLVVGAPNEDSHATGVDGDQADNSAVHSGAAYVFIRNGTTWSQQAYLKASNTNAEYQFGYVVSLSGNTLVVGAPNESSNATGVNGDQADNSAVRSGAAYVFIRNGTTWSQQVYLKASNTDADDLFGCSVSLDDDTLVVGAPWEDSHATGVNGDQADNSAVRSGAAYVFIRNGTAWSQQSYLKASNAQNDDQFGNSVSIFGDTLVVGAFYEDGSATGVNGDEANNLAADSGAAYVFTRSGITWSQQAYLKASNAESGDQFGNSVSISGDTLVVGAFYEDSNATGVNGDQADNSEGASGAAYVFTRSGTTWSQQAYLKASNAEGGDFFGSSVSLSGNTLVVGAYGEDSNATGVNGDQADYSASHSGAAYVYNSSAPDSISGRVVDGSSNGIPDVSVSDGAGHTTTTDNNGDYILSGLGAGTYTITAIKAGLFFTPPTREGVVPGGMGANFTGYPCIAPSGLNVCDLQPGDVLLDRSTTFAAIFSIGGTYFTHAAMYLGEVAAPGRGAETIMPRLAEAQGNMPNIHDDLWETAVTSNTFWSGDGLLDWAVIRPNVSNSVKMAAIQYIRDKAADESLIFDIAVPKMTNDKFYCSKLVWRSYLDVPGGKDLEVDVGISTILDQWVTPDDLFFSVLKGSTVVESRLGVTDNRILLTLWSPAHIMLVDPSGLRTGYDPGTGTVLNEIPLAIYSSPPDVEVETITAVGVGKGWNVVVTGYDNGGYKLEYNYLEPGTLNIVKSGNTAPAQVDEYEIEDPMYVIYLPLVMR